MLYSLDTRQCKAHHISNSKDHTVLKQTQFITKMTTDLALYCFLFLLPQRHQKEAECPCHSTLLQVSTLKTFLISGTLKAGSKHQRVSVIEKKEELTNLSIASNLYWLMFVPRIGQVSRLSEWQFSPKHARVLPQFFKLRIKNVYSRRLHIK